jgi:hypothetical protein
LAHSLFSFTDSGLEYISSFNSRTASLPVDCVGPAFAYVNARNVQVCTITHRLPQPACLSFIPCTKPLAHCFFVGIIFIACFAARLSG